MIRISPADMCCGSNEELLDDLGIRFILRTVEPASGQTTFLMTPINDVGNTPSRVLSQITNHWIRHRFYRGAPLDSTIPRRRFNE